MIIGIVTFWEAFDNYGQALQCWALQQSLKDLGHQPFVVRYKLNGLSPKSVPDLLGKVLHSTYNNLKMLLRGEYRESVKQHKNIKKRDFESFRQEHYQFSEKEYFSFEELSLDPPQADVFIAGSDQIWGWRIGDKESDVFFLGFGGSDVRRIAYAPSFGIKEYPNDLKDDLKNKLARFDALSVREKTGVNICSDAGFNAEHVLDPTLLLHGGQYDEIAEKVNFQEPYIFVYSINIKSAEELCWKELKSYADAHNTTVVATTSSGYVPAKELLSGASYVYPTVEGWLNRIKNSTLVVTTSFHGIAFSINLHKPFVYVPLGGSHSSGNNRVTELMDALGLRGRELTNERTIEEVINTPIDWQNVEQCLNERREKSIAYLNQALKL